jgi:hypothetical protein
MFQCGASGRSLFASRRWNLVVRTRAATNGRTVRINRPDTRNLSTWFRGSARPNGINSLSGRGPHRGYIYTPGCHLSTLPHQNLPFWHFVSEFLQAFGIILLLFVLFCIFPHSRYSSSLFLFISNC